MCGRYTLSTPGQMVQEVFDLDDEPDLVARYNIAPTQEAPVLAGPLDAAAPRCLQAMRWGLVPEHVREPTGGPRAINARSETVHTRPTFRNSFASRRCLVPADGFYEWQGRGGTRQPFHAHLRGGHLLAFAGLWSEWREFPDDTPLATYTILTCPANATLAPLHDRMPVVLSPEHWPLWLSSRSDPAELLSLLRPDPADEWEVRPVSTRVNSVCNDDPGCLGPPEQALLF